MFIRSRGAKRLSVVLGALGCCTGLCLSWWALSDYWARKAEAEEFSHLRENGQLLSLWRPAAASPWRVSGNLDCYNAGSKEARILVKDILDEQEILTIAMNQNEPISAAHIGHLLANRSQARQPRIDPHEVEDKFVQKGCVTLTSDGKINRTFTSVENPKLEVGFVLFAPIFGAAVPAFIVFLITWIVEGYKTERPRVQA